MIMDFESAAWSAVHTVLPQVICIQLNTADRNKESERNNQTQTNITNLIVIETDPVKPVSRNLNLNLYQNVIVRPQRDLLN